MLKRGFFIAFAIALLCLFLGGVGRLCVLRFKSGDVYPPLSSLRADPLGEKVFYDAISEINGLSVTRHYRSADKVRPEVPATFFYLGAKLNESAPEWADLWKLAQKGNRVVLVFSPTTSVPSTPKATPKPTPAEAADPKLATPEPEKKPKKELTWAGELKRVGITPHFEKTWESKNLKAHTTSWTEPSLTWHSVAWFENSDPARKALYTCAEKPVILECEVGRGSFVISADSYFLTNEAMRKERAPMLLSVLIGENRSVIFDEFQLNSAENPGVATLLRQYHLEGMFIVFALLASLYVWKNAIPFLPRVTGAEAEPACETIISGRNASEGFVNLLRRSIPPSKIIAVCLEEWNNAFAHQRGRAPEPSPESSPVRQFSELTKTLSNQKTNTAR